MAAHGLSPVAVPRLLMVACCRAQTRSTGVSRAALRLSSRGSWISLLHGMEIFPDQESNLHWQIDSYPLHHQGSPSGWISLLTLRVTQEMVEVRIRETFLSSEKTTGQRELGFKPNSHQGGERRGQLSTGERQSPGPAGTGGMLPLVDG